MARRGSMDSAASAPAATMSAAQQVDFTQWLSRRRGSVGADDEDGVSEITEQMARTGVADAPPSPLFVRVPNPFDPRDQPGDGDQEMPSASPLRQEMEANRVAVAPALPAHPRFDGKTSQDKREFIFKYEAYVGAINALQTNAFGAFAMPVSACIETRTRNRIARFEFEKNPWEITEQEWVNWFMEANKPALVDYTTVDQAMKALKMQTRWPEPESRMTYLQADLEKILDQFNLSQVAFDTEQRRLVKYLADALEPPQFRQVIQGRLTLQQNKAYKDRVVPFCKWVTAALKEYMTWEHATRPSTFPGSGGGGGRGGGGHGRGERGDRGERGERGPRGDRGDRGGRGLPPPASNPPGGGNGGGAGANVLPPARDSRRGCLKCQSTAHRLRDCPVATEAEKNTLLQEYTAGRRGRMRRVKTPTGEQEADDVARATDALDAIVDGLEVKALILDSGADQSLVARGVVDALVASGQEVTVEPIPEQSLRPVGDRVFVVKRAVVFNEVVLPTSAGPLMLRHLRCLVNDGDASTDLIVGRPVMKILGYSADDLLVKARERSEDWELAEAVEAGRATDVEPTCMERVCRVQAVNMVESWADTDDGDDRHEERTAYPAVAWDTAPISVPFVRKCIDIAEQNGLLEQAASELKALVQRHMDEFRAEFGLDPPVHVAPLQVRMKPDARPRRAQPRRYSPSDRAFLERHVKQLLKHGLVYANHRSRYASAPRIVKKKEQATDPNADPRMTADYRGVNDDTDPMLWPMPLLETVMAALEGAECYFTLDWFRGYWQLPLHEDSQEYFSFVTHEGVFTPTRVPMGATDSVAYCQGVVNEIFGDLIGHGVLCWLDDILGYAKTQAQLMELLGKVLERCAKFGLKLHAKKCVFFATEIKWCGKVVSADGVRHCPDRIQGLVEMALPQTAADLQQFLCAANWMRQSMPQFNPLTAGLYKLLDAAIVAAGSRKKARLAKFLLVDAGWDESHVEQLEAVRQALLRMVPLAHPSPTAEVCLYTDASQDFWGAVVTQLEPGELQLPLDEQKHRPLAFLSGRFVGAASRWATIEKEAFAIVESTRRLEYLLQRPRGFHLFTDHRNLVYIFNPHGVENAMARYQADKLQRWSLSLMAFKYVIEHVAGEANAWGDLLSRWGASVEAKDAREATRVARLAVVERVSPLQDPEFEWPTLTEIYGAQMDAIEKDAEVHEDMVAFDQDRNVWTRSDGRVWVPEDQVELQQRLCIVAHAGASGHRGAKTTAKALSDLFWWATLQEDVATFVRECLHCMITVGGTIPRPLGETLYATKPNEVLDFDFLTMSEGQGGIKYVLVLKDNMSGFVELVACVEATSDEVYRSLLDWFKRFGVVRQWVSDQGTHFKNQVIERLQRVLGAHHHFTTAYTPWANGSVEVVNREVLKVVRALLSERKLGPADWPLLLPVVQAALNQMRADRLGGHSPLTAFTALPGGSQLQSILHPHKPLDATIDWVEEEIQMHLVDVRRALDNMHREMVDAAELRKRKNRERVAAKKGVKLPKFAVGDFVLAATATGKRGNKLAVLWRGPKRIVKAHNDYTFDVQDLVPPYAVTIKHAARLQLYREAARGSLGELTEQAIHGEGGHLVEQLLACRLSADTHQWEIQVKWYGLDEIEASWEPAEAIQQDVPVLFDEYLRAAGDTTNKQRMAEALREQARRDASVPAPRVPRQRRRRQRTSTTA